MRLTWLRRLSGRTPTVASPAPGFSQAAWPFASLARSTKAFERARSAARSLQWEEAARHLSDAEADPPDRLKFLTLKADVSAATGHWAVAEGCWQTVIDQFPDMVDAHGAKATAIRAQGRTTEAVEAYLVAMDQAPTSLGPPSMLAHMLEHLPPDLVRSLIPRLRPALEPHLKDRRNGALALWSMAKVAIADGDLREALRFLRAAQEAALTNTDIRADLDLLEARAAGSGQSASR